MSVGRAFPVLACQEPITKFPSFVQVLALPIVKSRPDMEWCSSMPLKLPSILMRASTDFLSPKPEYNLMSEIPFTLAQEGGKSSKSQLPFWFFCRP
jgi:hypothetical protein